MIVNDKVYDLTDFIDYHPAGHEIMLEYAGTDATNAFNEKPHTLDAADMLEKYLIGELVLEDRMFTWLRDWTTQCWRTQITWEALF